MRELHIVRVAEQFPPSRGGLAPGMLALSRAQHDRGHQVTVITRDCPESRTWDQELPFRVIRVPGRSLFHFGWQATAVIRNLPDRVDIIHCHGPAAAAVLCRKRRGDSPVVLTLHTVRRYQYGLFKNLQGIVASFQNTTGLRVEKSPRLYHRLSPRLIWELLAERYMCRRADHLALVAGYFAPLVAAYYGVSASKCSVTYNGSEFTQADTHSRAEAKASLGYDAADRLITYIGRLDWVKRAHLLVQALPMILEAEKHARLLLVGDGDQRRDLEILVAKMGLNDTVRVFGWVPHNELQRVYRSADCLCLPSIWEGFPKVILEAMSMQVPVVASDIPANREILLGGELGCLVNNPDPASWASAVNALLANPVQAVLRAERASRLLDERYRWSHVAERLDSAYETLLRFNR